MESFDRVMEKLHILADAAKYDASCGSAGLDRRNSSSSGCAGVCHSWTADGRCVSLLKVLYTNRCVYDCEYCVNRRSNGEMPRASFTPGELAELTVEFYRRNYIEGLFLSSAVDGSPDKTMEEMWECLRILREDFGFLGYIHAKIIPGASPELVHMIGLLADRLSVNIELPSSESLNRLAPQKKAEGILNPMRQIRGTLEERGFLKGPGNGFSKYLYAPDRAKIAMNKAIPRDFYGEKEAPALSVRQKDAEMAVKRERFAPAGQTTQLIVGASGESDLHILSLSHSLYSKLLLKRVYFSAYIPLVKSPLLPPAGSAAPMAREHRLYQADWLMRFYGFEAGEIVDESNPNLDLELDPKLSWALRHPECFPMEINRASPEELLRIPGVGELSAKRIIRQRKSAALTYDNLKNIGVVLKRAKYFITVGGKYYGGGVGEKELREHFIMQSGGVQLDMLAPAFSPAAPALRQPAPSLP